MVILDFDDTLFDTAVYKEARLDALAQVGVSEDHFWRSYRDARKNSEGMWSYSDERHARLLEEQYGYPYQTVLSALHQTGSDTVISSCLITGALDFLSSIKKRGKPLILLSCGDPAFQEKKVRGSGIVHFFDRLFLVDSSKVAVLHELEKKYDLSNAWFINDKIEESIEVHDHFSQLNVMIKKVPGRDPELYTNLPFPYSDSLAEIEERISQHS